jgi:hypothetical protein
VWTWSLVHRSDDDRPGVRHAVKALLSYADSQHWRTPPGDRWWVPMDDPHRAILGAAP